MPAQWYEWIWIWVAVWEPQYLWTFFTWACHICSLLWVNMNMSGSLRTSVQCSQIEKRDQPEPNLPQFFNASFFFNVFTNKLPKGCHCHVGQFAKLQEAWWAPEPRSRAQINYSFPTDPCNREPAKKITGVLPTFLYKCIFNVFSLTPMQPHLFCQGLKMDTLKYLVSGMSAQIFKR